MTPKETGISRREDSNKELELTGRFESEKNYREMLWFESERNRILTEEHGALMAKLREAEASGVERYSDEWFEMYNAADSVLTAINESKQNTLGYNNSIRELDDSMFDYTQDQISKITDENDFLLSLIDNEKKTDDNGNMTEYGDAAMGLHAVNYNTYMEKASNYAKEIQKYDKMLADDPSNQKLIARRQELLGLQQDSIKSAEDEKKAMVDLVEEGIEAQLDSLSKLIDKYKDSLTSAKNLYDFQKRIQEQAKNISDIEKQLAAYQNDFSEETKAKVQQLKVELESAKEDLKESEYDQYISDQEDLLDDLYDSYEEFMNERLDETNAIVNEQLNRVNDNQNNIWNTLKGIADKEGYDYTPELEKIWNTLGGNVVGNYDNGNKPDTSTSKTTEGLGEKTEDYKEESDKKAGERTDGDKTRNEESKKAVEDLTKELSEALKSGTYKKNPGEYISKSKQLDAALKDAVSNKVISEDSDEYKKATSVSGQIKQYAASEYQKLVEAGESLKLDIKSGKHRTDFNAVQSKIDALKTNLENAVSSGIISADSQEYKNINTVITNANSEMSKAKEDAKKALDTARDVTSALWDALNGGNKNSANSGSSAKNTHLNKIKTSQNKLAKAQKSGDLKKNPSKYKKEVANLKTLLNDSIKQGYLKKTDKIYTDALAVYKSANKIVNPVTKTTTTSTSGNKTTTTSQNKTTEPKQIKVGGKINAKGAKIYATPGGKATSQYFSSDPVYIVIAEKNGYIQVRHHKAKSGSSGWFKKSDVKAYKHGGLVDQTGLAWLDGTPSKPETVLDANDSKNLMYLRDTLKDLASKQGSISFVNDYTKYRGVVSSTFGNDGLSDKLLSSIYGSSMNVNESVNNTFGDTIISIDHVEDYNDLVTKMKNDKKFEKLIQAMTVGRLQGGSALAKNKYSWKQ